MTNKTDNRVLGRMAARILSEQEMSDVNGGAHTGAPCTFNPKTGDIDGPIADCG